MELYNVYAIELRTIKTEKKTQGVDFGVYRKRKTYYSSNVVSLIAKRELNL